MITYAWDTTVALLALVGLVALINHLSPLPRALNRWYQRRQQRRWREMGRKYRITHPPKPDERSSIELHNRIISHD